MNQLFDEALEMARNQKTALTWHPEFQELADFAKSDGASQSQERILEHLAQCPDCADLVLAIRKESQPVDSAQEQPEAGEEAWTRFLQYERVRRDAESVEHQRVPSSHSTPPRFSPRLLLGLGLAAAVALGWLLGTFGTAIEKNAKPAPILAAPLVLMLQPIDPANTQRGVEDPRAAFADLALVLTSNRAAEYAAYRAVFHGEGASSLEIEGLQRQEDRSFVLVIPQGNLKPGTYRVETFGLDQEVWRPMDRYLLTVAAPFGQP